MEISKSLRLSSQAAPAVFRGGPLPDAGGGRIASEVVEPAPETGLDTQRRAAALATIGELEESSERESRRAAYEGLSNRARIAINAYQTQQDAHRDQAKTEMSRMLGVDYYA